MFLLFLYLLEAIQTSYTRICQNTWEYTPSCHGPDVVWVLLEGSVTLTWCCQGTPRGRRYTGRRRPGAASVPWAAARAGGGSARGRCSASTQALCTAQLHQPTGEYRERHETGYNWLDEWVLFCVLSLPKYFWSKKTKHNWQWQFFLFFFCK